MGFERTAGDIITIDSLPDFILEYIFKILNSYDDFDAACLVSKRWRKLGVKAASSMIRLFKRCEQYRWELYEPDIDAGPFLVERCSHSSCYHERQKAMFIFGGCTATYTAFNDLWKYDLSRRRWHRIVISGAPFPTPKALATLLPYGDNLLLFGGFSKSSPNPIYQTSTFYNELFLYNSKENKWEEIATQNSAPKLASHSASIVGDSMIVFGGSMGNCCSGELWILNILDGVWLQPFLAENGKRPSARYGHSQVLIDATHLLIVGGCGGPNMICNDAWLLEFDLTLCTPWKWTEIKITNPELSAPQLWCHAACRVGLNLLVLSRPVNYKRKVCVGCQPMTVKSHSGRFSSSSSSASSASPSQNNPSEEKHRGSLKSQAVAKVEAEDKLLSACLSRRRVLITSKSLDEQNRLSNAAAQLPDNDQTNRRTVDLQRAHSIPAIIVGEIPALVVTSSEAPSTSRTVQVGVNITKEDAQSFQVSRPPRRKFIHGKEISIGSEQAFRPSSSTSLKETENTSFSKSLRLRSSEKDSPQCSPRFAEESHQHLGGNVGSERTKRKTKGEETEGRQASSEYGTSSDGRGLSEDHSQSSSLLAAVRPSLCVYTLNLSQVLSCHKASWQQQAVEPNAPEDTILYSICVGRAEAIVFGGMRSDNTMEGLSPFTHNINNRTYVLKPRYYLG